VNPDFVFLKLKMAVFVDGCYWHGCPRHFIRPKNNAPFWRTNIEANRTTDRLVNRMLWKMGWRVVRIWEHEILSRNDAIGCRAAACRRAVSPMSCGPATSAGPTHHSVIAGTIRKARPDCMNPA
jgi:G:T-mismatch repair DNA endonuclease (very short patch repair protein)